MIEEEEELASLERQYELYLEEQRQMEELMFSERNKENEEN